MNIIRIEEKDYDKEVIQNAGVTCVKFYAPWCGPCRMLSQVMEDIEDEKYNAIKVVEVNVDNAQNIARQLGVMSIPTMVFYVDGAVAETVVGFRNAPQLKQLFDNYL